MSRINRKQAITVGEAIKEMFRSEHLSATHNTHRIFWAWDEASGAGPFTIRRYFRDGVLYVTMNSSVLASRLSMQKEWLAEKINAILADDPLFIRDDVHVGTVREIKIK